MSSKAIMMGSFILFSTLGSYLPMLVTSNILISFTGGILGGIFGIWTGWKIINNV